jgi:DNA-directed RNA polymerase specialized sigma24 family protein
VPADDRYEAASGRDAEERARLGQLCDRLATLLGEMPAAHRRAFELGVLQKMPYREIARHTGWSVAQVKINVYRGRKRIIRGLGEGLGSRTEASP